MTAKQLVRRTGLSFDSCRDVVGDLANHGLIECLNHKAVRSRLYWPSELGARCLLSINSSENVKTHEPDLHDVNWELYGWVCFSHRAAILKTLTTPMQPSEIKRRARSRDPRLCMSANNVRDVIRLFLAKGIVKPVRIHKKAHLRYEPSEQGKTFQLLLLRAEAFA